MSASRSRWCWRRAPPPPRTRSRRLRSTSRRCRRWWTTPAPQADEERSVSRKAQKRLEAEERNRRFARRKDLEARLKAAEKEVEKLSGSRKALENRLAAPDLYGEDRKEDLKRCLREQADVTSKLHKAEEQWLMISAELEALAAGANAG